MGWKPGSPTTGLRRWGGNRGPQRQVFVVGVENRGPQRQVFVVGVETGVPNDRSSSLGWKPGSPRTGLRHWGGVADGVEGSALKIHVSTNLNSPQECHPDRSPPWRTEWRGSAVAFSWLRVNTVPCKTAVAFSWLRVEHSSMQDCGYIFMISGGIRITTNPPTCSNGMPPLYTKLCPHPVQRNPPQAMNRAAENSIIPPKAAVVPAII